MEGQSKKKDKLYSPKVKWGKKIQFLRARDQMQRERAREIVADS